MRKVGLAVICAGLLSMSTAFAAKTSPVSDGYHGGYTAVSSKIKSLFPATDITIINASNSMIKVAVPNTPVNDWVYTQSSPYHVTNQNGSYYTNILIQDVYYNTIFNATVCPRALITIFGGYGHFTWNVDEEYCY